MFHSIRSTVKQLASIMAVAKILSNIRSSQIIESIAHLFCPLDAGKKRIELKVSRSSIHYFLHNTKFSLSIDAINLNVSCTHKGVIYILGLIAPISESFAPL